MTAYLDIVDPTASVTEKGEPNARLVPDGSYTRVEFTPEERKRFNEYVRLILEEGRRWYKPLLRKHAAALAAYEGLGSKKQAIQLSISRAMLNQAHAWLMNRCFSKLPQILTGQALGDHMFEVIIPPRENPQTGEIIEEAQIATVTATDEADGAADMLNYRWVHRIGIRALFDAWIKSGLQSGVLPALLKFNVNDDNLRLVTDNALKPLSKEDGSPALNDQGNVMIVRDQEARTVEGTEFTSWRHIPGERFMIEPGATSIDAAGWCSFEDEIKKRDLRRKVMSGQYTFGFPAKERRAKDEEQEFQSVAQMALSTARSQPAAESESRVGSKPTREAHGESSEAFQPAATDSYFEFYTRWPILTADEVKAAKAEKRKPKIVEMEIVVDYHLGIASMLGNPLKLPWWSGKRMVVDLFFQPRPGSYSGNSPGEDVAPYQRYLSQLFQLWIQSLIVQNQSACFLGTDAPAWSEIEKTGGRLKAGFVYRVNNAAEVQVIPLGKGAQGLQEAMNLLRQLANELGVYTQWDTGTGSLTRVTSGAFGQQQTLVKMQPEYMYENFCAAVSRLALMDLQGLIQFGPTQKIPPFAQKTRTVVENLFHLPRKMVTDAEITFSVAATADDETKQAALATAVQVLDTITKENQQVIEALGKVMQPGMIPQIQELAIRVIGRSEEALGQVLKHIREDYGHYIITEDIIRKMIAELHQMQAQISGGAGPGAPEMAVAQQQAAQQPPPPPPPPAPEPPSPPEPAKPPEIKYNIQLKADMPPTDEAGAAIIAGLRNAHAQQPAGPPEPEPVAPAPGPVMPPKPQGA